MKPTTFIERFGDSMEVLCGERPTDQKLSDWHSRKNEELQEFACNKTRLKWAQGICVIDAALLLAESPAEGEGHLPANS